MNNEMFGCNVWPRERRNSYKKTREFYSLNNVWTNSICNSIRHSGGSVIKGLKSSGAQTEDEWHEWFFAHQRTLPEFEQMVNTWQSISGLSKEIAMNQHIIHTFDESWKGFASENNTIAFLNTIPKLHNNVQRAAEKWDIAYGIDAAVMDSSNGSIGFTYGFQIKSDSFFKAGKKLSFHWDKLRIFFLSAEALGLKVAFINASEAAAGIYNPMPWRGVIGAE